MAARRDVIGRILNYDLPPSPPPRPSLRIEPLVDAQAAGVGRARYGGLPPQPPAYANNNPKPQYYRNNPVLQPLSNNQLNQQQRGNQNQVRCAPTNPDESNRSPV